MSPAVHGWLDDVIGARAARSDVGAIVPPSLRQDYGLMPGYFGSRLEREAGDALPSFDDPPPRECVGGVCRLDAPSTAPSLAFSPTSALSPLPPAVRALAAPTVASLAPIAAAATKPTPGASPMAFDFNAFVNAAERLGSTALSFVKADRAADLEAERIRAAAERDAAAIRAGSAPAAGVNVSGVLGTLVPIVALVVVGGFLVRMVGRR